MFKFKGISSEEMQVVIEEEEHFIARAAQRYEMTEIEGRDGAEFDTLGYSVVERPIYVQCLNIDKIDDILAWLDGEGEFEYKGRKTIARFYSQLEPQRSACIRIIDASFIRDPFWTKANDEFEIVKDRKDRQATGESITLSDSAEYKFKSLELSGNSKQETTTENLFDNTWEQGGVDSNTGEEISSSEHIRTRYIKVFPNHLYSMSRTINTSYNMLRFYDSDKNYLGNQETENMIIASTSDKRMSASVSSMTFTIINADVAYMRLADASNNLSTIYTLTTEAINIDYPSDVKSCGDNVNLLDFTNYQSFTANNTYYAIKANDFNLSSNEEYIFNYIASGDFSTLNAIKLWFRDANNSSFKEVLANNEFSLTEEELNKLSYIQIVVQSLISGRTYSGYIYPKIEKGSVATPYSPYGQGCISEVVSNKNSFDKKELTIELGVIGTNGEFYPSTIRVRAYDILVKAKEKYTISSQNSDLYVALYYYDKNNKFIWSDNTWNSMPYTFTPPIDSKILKLMFKKSSDDISISDINIQLEEGEVATDYIPHAEQLITIPTQQPMRAVGDVRDGFIKKDGKRYERHWIKKLPLTYARVKGKNCYYYVGDRQTNIKKPSSNSEVVDWIKCNIAQSGVSANYLNSNDVLGVIISNIGDIGINFSNASGLTTIELATQFLEQNNVYTLYVMETPLDIECTEEQNSILDELEKAQSYKNVTHIYSTNEVSPIANVTYYTETDEKIQNNGNIESRPILRLEKTTSDDVEMMINNIRFKYHFNNEEYVEIDCEEKETKYDDLNRSRQIEIGYEFPKLNVGENDIVMYEGDCIIKVLRKDRWL